jgi:tRNA pseudouridine32 synthase/23S rRNA pseudouridine746 synthase
MIESSMRRWVPPSRLYLRKLESPPATLLEHLVACFPHVPAEIWRRRFLDGRITTDNGTVLSLATPYRYGITVRYWKGVQSEPLPIEEEEVLDWDDHIVVADKPPGMVVTPTGDHLERSLLVRLQRRTGIPTLSPVHRLDGDTAGLVLFCIRPDERQAYHRLFAGGNIKRQYQALARMSQLPEKQQWRVESRIGRGEPWFRQQVVEGESNAITHIQFLSAERSLGLFRICPESGKKHQIRIHMASIGFPILGDRLYPILQDRSARLPPLQLLAARLAFLDPVTGTTRDFVSRRRLAGW